ncbi:hypothetical protein FBU30_001615, partial [Linnemannia zychae]
MNPLQSFRQRANNQIIQIKTRIHPNIQQSVILWQDICGAFPEALQVYDGTEYIAPECDSDLHPIEPQCILYHEDKVLEVVVKEVPYFPYPLPSREYFTGSSIPVDIFTEYCEVLMTNESTTLSSPSPVSMNQTDSSQLLDPEDNVTSTCYSEMSIENSFQVLDVSMEKSFSNDMEIPFDGSTSAADNDRYHLQITTNSQSS